MDWLSLKSHVDLIMYINKKQEYYVDQEGKKGKTIQNLGLSSVLGIEQSASLVSVMIRDQSIFMDEYF